MRIKLGGFFIAWGLMMEGVPGAVMMVSFIGTTVALPFLRAGLRMGWKRVRRWRAPKQTVTLGEDEFVVRGRTTLVRIQEPKVLLVPLAVGGELRGWTWQDVTVARYPTNPEDALEQAVDEYEGYRVAAYREVDPTEEFTVDAYANLNYMDEAGWIEVDPERDLPDE